MIKEITKEIDETIARTDRNNPRLLELVVDVMADEKGLPQKFVNMCYGIHEADTDTAEEDEKAKEFNLHPPGWFIDFLKKTKEENIEFWSDDIKG